MKKHIDVAVVSVVKAGDYAKKRKGKIRYISYKGEINLVTDVDKICEDIIVGTIKKYFPSHSILSEENYTKRTPAEYRWVIDPLDGTTNYAHGLPIYSVSVALERNDEIVLGIVYDPEREELFKAERDRGSYLNKKRIRVSKTQNLKKALLVTGFAYNIRRTTQDNMNYFTRFLKTSQAVRRLGSAALDISYVACGRFDGFWEMSLHPWDSAAGLLIVREAGGKVTRFDGSPYTHYDKEILATNSKIHTQMMRVLKA